ncbi:hypothetical protein DSO57_1039710 [Entomophthora muscae]|uniref:Uncharacterized protein n=1 Tax=Entomophthora muscae TaxID=34485 RepID=A0ACC2S1U4_9FUNG|nr:hypothetical protein DSO57_1039710 [Entomophthora muscae]
MANKCLGLKFGSTTSELSSLIDSANLLFATSQGTLVTLWQPTPKYFVPPAGCSPSQFKDGVIPLMTFQVSFVVQTMSFAQNFDCLAILGTSDEVVLFSIDFTSTVQLTRFLKATSKYHHTQEKFNTHPNQTYLPHPFFVVSEICGIASEKVPFKVYNIRSLLKDQMPDEKLSSNVSFTFSTFLSGGKEAALVFWGSDNVLYQLNRVPKFQLVGLKLGDGRGIVSLDVSSDKSKCVAITEDNNLIVYNFNDKSYSLLQLPQFKTQTPQSLTLSPIDPSKVAITFTSGEIAVVSFLRNKTMEVCNVLSNGDVACNVSKVSFSVHDRQLAWANSHGLLCFNDLQSNTVKTVDVSCPLSSTVFHNGCKTLISFTHQGGLVVHSLRNMNKPLWQLPVPTTSPLNPIIAAAFKPLSSKAQPSSKSFLSKLFPSSANIQAPLKEALSKATPFISSAQSSSDVMDPDPSFTECFSPIRHLRTQETDSGSSKVKTFNGRDKQITKRPLFPTSMSPSKIPKSIPQKHLSILDPPSKRSSSVSRLNVSPLTPCYSEVQNVSSFKETLNAATSTTLDNGFKQPAPKGKSHSLEGSQLHFTNTGFTTNHENNLSSQHISNEIVAIDSGIHSNDVSSFKSPDHLSTCNSLAELRSSPLCRETTKADQIPSHPNQVNSQLPAARSFSTSASPVPQTPCTNQHKPHEVPAKVNMEYNLASIEATKEKISKQLLQGIFDDTLYDFKFKASSMIADIQANVVEQMIKTKRKYESLFSKARTVPILEKRIRTLEEQNKQLRSSMQP